MKQTLNVSWPKLSPGAGGLYLDNFRIRDHHESPQNPQSHSWWLLGLLGSSPGRQCSCCGFSGSWQAVAGITGKSWQDGEGDGI